MNVDDADRGLSLFGRTISPRGLLPRVVLTLLLVGSFVGIWLSHLADPVTERVLWWVPVVALGCLAGGLYWRLVLFSEELFDEAGAAERVRARWRRIETVAIWALALGGLAGFGTVVSTYAPPPEEGVFIAGFALAPVCWLAIRRGEMDDGSRATTTLRSGLLLAALASLVGFAWMATGMATVNWAVRLGHLGSFALWLGGAAWHNFVVLPTIRSDPTVAPAMKAQARRFRRHLPAVIGLFLATGVYQALQLVTLTPRSLLGLSVGRLVLFKFFLLAVLTGLVVVNLTRSPPIGEDDRDAQSS